MSKFQDQPSSRTDLFDRRAVVSAGLGLVATATAVSAQEHDHKHHEHHAGSTGPALHQALIDVALECVNRGQVCNNHCLELLGAGDTSLKECMRTVSAMLPMCQALASLAALNSPRLKQLAKVCIDVCADCENECKKHEKHHAACKACRESCTKCIEACKKII